MVVSTDEEVLPENVQLLVEQTGTTDASERMVKQIINENYGLVAAYNVTLLSDGQEIQPDGEIEIGLPIPAAYENSIVQVVCLQEDGSVETFETRRSGGEAYIKTNHLSVYAIAAPTEYSEGKRAFPWLAVAYSTAVVLAGIGILLLRRSRKKREDERMNAKVKGITYALIGGTCWGLSGIVGKLLFDTRGLNAQWLVTARLIIGGIIMLFIAFLQKKEKIFDVWKNKKTACSMLLFAAFGMLACQLTYFLCVQYSNPATATVLQYTSPVMIMVLCLFLDKKLPRIIDILVLIAVVVGVFLMSTHGDIHTLAISQKALILGMIAAVTIVFYTVWPVSLLREFGSPSVIGWGMFLGGIMLAPFSKFWVLSGKWDGYTVILVGIVIIFGTVCAFTCYLKGVMYLGPVKSSLFSCMEPLVSTILTITVLHQTFAMADLVGIAVIIISVTSLAVNDVIEEAKTHKKNQTKQTEQKE